jgi:hypothetical protein
VGNSDSIRKLVAILEPLVLDLEEDKRILSDDKKELENVSRLIAYTKDNIEMVGIYADQEIITNNLDNLKVSVDDYKASCYLLKTENEQVKGLPQYKDAFNLISDIMEYFKLHKAELMVEIQELTKSCAKKEIEKKYYDLLSCPNPLIENIKEFVDFLKEHNVKDDEIINILYNTIHDNIVNYGLKNN